MSDRQSVRALRGHALFFVLALVASAAGTAIAAAFVAVPIDSGVVATVLGSFIAGVAVVRLAFLLADLPRWVMVAGCFVIGAAPVLIDEAGRLATLAYLTFLAAASGTLLVVLSQRFLR